MYEQPVTRHLRARRMCCEHQSTLAPRCCYMLCRLLVVTSLPRCPAGFSRLPTLRTPEQKVKCVQPMQDLFTAFWIGYALARTDARPFRGLLDRKERHATEAVRTSRDKNFLP